jgi:adenosylmethionine-8-amino-7-oxononanoate aminotransferase
MNAINKIKTKNPANKSAWLDDDSRYVWHPYSSMHSENPVYAVQSASGVRLKLADGSELVDGMSSWWCAIHGYNHAVLNAAIHEQLQSMSHIMFGGLTHEPAVRLASTLVAITPEGLQHVFFSDSGSVAVEVAMKMAIQFWHARAQPRKQKMLSLRSGYHGDTFGAMSVCDPVTGMHGLFSSVLTEQFFVASPRCGFNEDCSDDDIVQIKKIMSMHNQEIAAVILEPVVQGAGGMRFYSPQYLKRVRQLCDYYNVLLIADEIATGFGRSGKLFACEHAEISPDIMCVGKALTGGYMTLAATLTTQKVSDSISDNDPGVFMHGPTFMGNPLACAVANASIQLLLESDWQKKIKQIEHWLLRGLKDCAELESVDDVRVLGAIGVVQLRQAVDMKTISAEFVRQGVWVRPFGKLVYLMPPYIISESDTKILTDAVFKVLSVSSY